MNNLSVQQAIFLVLIFIQTIDGFSAMRQAVRVMRSSIFYDGPLVIHDLPTESGTSPDGRPTRDSLSLKERVREEVVVVSNLKAMKVLRLPAFFNRVLVPLLQSV
jgi:hypothetical protein